MKNLTDVEILALYEQTENIEYLKIFKKKQFNSIRDEKLKNLVIKMELNGDTVRFNADEISQDRLNRAINALPDGQTITWIDADDNKRVLTKNDCLTGLQIAGKMQTELFVKCNELKRQVDESSAEKEINRIKWD